MLWNQKLLSALITRIPGLLRLLCGCETAGSLLAFACLVGCCCSEARCRKVEMFLTSSQPFLSPFCSPGVKEGGEIGVAGCVVGLVLFFLVLSKQGFSYFMSLMEVELGALMVTFSNSWLAAAP